MRFSTLGDAFDFFGEIECTVRTVAPLTATLNNLESIQVRYADVGYFRGLYKDARCKNKRWHFERLPGQGRVKLLNHPTSKRRWSLDPKCTFSAQAG
jgi:hypothetical protein